MKNDFLFPHAWMVPGWILTLFFGTAGILWLCEVLSFQGAFGDALDEIVSIGLYIGLLLVAFSRERDEDEYTMRIRSSSLVWAVIADSLLMILATLAVYELNYLYVMIVQLYLLLVLYIVKFRIAVGRTRRAAARAEDNLGEGAR